MNADLLRRAAKEMREKAEAAVLACGDEPWLFDYGYPGYDVKNSVGLAVVQNGTEETAEHIASWHPAVALAAADLLDMCARIFPYKPEAIALARAYLGQTT